MKRTMAGLALATALLTALGTMTATAMTGRPSAGGAVMQSAEYDVKAAYLFNFAKFIEWPEATFTSDSEPLRLCVYGSDPFEDALRAIDGKSVRERRLSAEPVRRLPLVDRCHILFIPRREFRLADELLERVDGLGVLTVTEFEESDRPRGIINLTRREGRIVLQIAPGRAERGGLRISSRLLQLAEVIDEDLAEAWP